MQIKQEDYTDKFLTFFEENKEVKKFDHVSMISDLLKIKKYAGTDEDKTYDITFVLENEEKRLERFEIDTSLTSMEQAKISHSIYLDQSVKKALRISEGDSLVILYGKKEFTFTVAGFYGSGLWTMGTKAVISPEDFSYMEKFLDRYEIIVVNTTVGTDGRNLLKAFETFAKELSISDLSASMTSFAYEDIVFTNQTNMSLLSTIVCIMAGVIAIALIVMIRFRIVSDINEQLVSIGMLEAIGYK